MNRIATFASALVVAAGAAYAISGRATAAQSTDTVAIDADDIGGVVTGPKGPEAGVWVVAETTELPTKFANVFKKLLRKM